MVMIPRKRRWPKANVENNDWKNLIKHFKGSRWNGRVRKLRSVQAARSPLLSPSSFTDACAAEIHSPTRQSHPYVFPRRSSSTRFNVVEKCSAGDCATAVASAAQQPCTSRVSSSPWAARNSAQ